MVRLSTYRFHSSTHGGVTTTGGGLSPPPGGAHCVIGSTEARVIIGSGPATSRNRGGRRAAGTVGWLSRATVLALVGSMAFSACGTKGAPVVASVQGSTISPGALAHWTAIKRIELQSSSAPASASSSVQQKALAFLADTSLDRLCLLIFNMSEFLYVD